MGVCVCLWVSEWVEVEALMTHKIMLQDLAGKTTCLFNNRPTLRKMRVRNWNEINPHSIDFKAKSKKNFLLRQWSRTLSGFVAKHKKKKKTASLLWAQQKPPTNLGLIQLNSVVRKGWAELKGDKIVQITFMGHWRAVSLRAKKKKKCFFKDLCRMKMAFYVPGKSIWVLEQYQQW